MMTGVVTMIERIRPTDWPVLRDLRLAALNDSPDAFGQSYDDAARQSEAEWRATAQASTSGDRRAWFIGRAEPDGAPVGIVQARRRPPDDCLLFSMWVAPTARRTGAGSALVNAVEAWGRRWGAARIVLWVIAGNESAMRFYDRIGFRILDSGADAESGYAYGAVAMERSIMSGDTQR
jgi:RimJ/RimL family protein N-acetyltransferase